MVKDYLKFIPVFALLIGVAGFSYYKFSEFKPESLKKNAVVKGSSAQTSVEIPFPKEYKELSTDETAERQIVIIETMHTPEAVQNFYKTVLTEKNWEIETESTEGVFLVTKYKKQSNQEITITSSIQETTKTTIVSINIKKAS